MVIGISPLAANGRYDTYARKMCTATTYDSRRLASNDQLHWSPLMFALSWLQEPKGNFA